MSRSSIFSSERITESADRRHTRRLALRLLLRAASHLVPLCLVLVGFEAALWVAGETWPMQRVHSKEVTLNEQGTATLFGRRLLPEEMQAYKVAGLRRRSPAIVALGSSTSMQYRDIAFGPYRKQFYNLGGMVHRIEDLDTAGSLLEESRSVSVVVVGLDLWWFNDNWRPYTEPLATLITRVEAPFEPKAHLRAIRETTRRLGELDGAFFDGFGRRTSPINGELAIGLEASTGQGFRGADGSFQYRDFLLRSRRRVEFQDAAGAVERIREGTLRFERGRRVSEASLAKLEAFVDRLGRRGMLVCGVIGPFSTEALAALQASPGHRDLFATYRATMRQVFESRGLPFVDASDPSRYGLDDRYLIDGMHGTEVYMTHVVRELHEAPALRAKLDRLQRSHFDDLLEHPETTPTELAAIPGR